MNVQVKKLIDDLRSLFYCRQDVYAEGYLTEGNKVGYPPARDATGRDLPLSDDAIYKHLKGESYLGIYPLFDETQVSWLAMDFDASADDDEDPLEMAMKQKERFLEAGIISYVERSRSGTGAHVWIFVDEPISAGIIRDVAKAFLVNATTFDRMFPNQASAQGGYGNLIAMPYQGEAFKNNNSAFLSDSGIKITPQKFIKMVKKNARSFITKLYEESLPVIGEVVGEKVSVQAPKKALSGALKVVTFSNWVKSARERMSNQGQEPEFYALCCQFAQLEDGERLAYEFGRLHPYSDARIAQKFEQAQQVNKPHTCKTLREELGWEETADLDYGVTFPYELANMSFKELMSGRRGRAYSWKDVGQEVINTTKEIYKSDERFGWAYGYDRLDDLSELRPGNLLILGARPGMGKSSFSIDLTHNLNSRGIPVYWGSIEMTKEEVGMKYLSNLSEVATNNIRKGNLDYNEWRAILGKYKKFQDLPLYIDDETSNLDKMIDIFAGLIAHHGPGLIIIDYIELISMLPGETMFSLTNRVIVELKALAKILQVPILALSNFNRKAEQDLADDVDPMDGWLRNSGLLEQTADVILYLLGKKAQGIVERTVRIQKERHSGTGGMQFSLWFEGSLSKFHNKPPRSVGRELNLDQLQDGTLALI